jgi:SAM-dependent MidA family methyltransferase
MPSPGPSDHARAIAERLAPWAASDGVVPFDRFQAVALHDPDLGYYRGPGLRLGPDGDFYTAPQVHPMFGAALAERVRTEWAAMGLTGGGRVVEVGAGDGSLAASVIAHLREAPTGAPDLEYVLVEPSEALRSRALERLERRGFTSSVRVAPALSSDGPFEGVVLANELLDALPARRLLRREGTWCELGVRWDGQRFQWAESELRPIRGPPLPETAEDGVVLELSDVAAGFVREVADHLLRGVALVLDYGAEEGELLGRPPGGTLQSVRAHRAMGDPLATPGESDLSVFVNFTRVRAAARSAGLRERYYGPQAEALGRWGIERVIASEEDRAATPAESVKVRLAAKSLLFGFGSFRVLEVGPAVA